MKSLRIGVSVLMALLYMLATHAAFGQTVTNPTTVEFTVSADHNAVQFGTPVVTRYELRVYAVGAPQPITTSDLGKPAAPANPATPVSFDRPATFAAVPAVGPYEAAVAAIGPAGEGVSARVPFAAQVRIPAPATGFRVR